MILDLTFFRLGFLVFDLPFQGNVELQLTFTSIVSEAGLNRHISRENIQLKSAVILLLSSTVELQWLEYP